MSYFDENNLFEKRPKSRLIQILKWVIAIVILACIITFFVGVYYNHHAKMHKDDINKLDETIKDKNYLISHTKQERDNDIKKKQELVEHHKQIEKKGIWLMSISVSTGFVCGGILAVMDMVKSAKDKSSSGDDEDLNW